MAVALVYAMAGCSNAAKIAEVPADDGATRTVDAPFDDVKTASIDALRQMGMTIQVVEDEPKATIIRFTRPVSAMNWGAVGRATVERTKPVTMRLVYEKRLGFNMTGYDSVFAGNFYSRVFSALGMPAPPKPNR